VSVGVAALIVVLSVMNGFYDFVRDLLVSLDPHVRIESVEGGGLTSADSLVLVARSVPGVVNASPYVQGKALLLHGGRGRINKVVIVRGVDPDNVAAMGDVVGRTGFGRFDVSRRDGKPGIVLGVGLAQRFGLTPQTPALPASEVGLLSAQAIDRMFNPILTSPQVFRFSVRGLYDVESVNDESHVYIDLRDAQRLFRTGASVTGIELRLSELDRAGVVRQDLEKVLPPERYKVQTWYDLKRSLYDVMRLEKWAASLILMLIIVVAAFNIVGSITMVVIEKQRDIGVLRAMGVTRRGIREIFRLEGLLIGVLGTGIGLLLGLGVALLQKYFQLVPLVGAESFLLEAYPVSIRLLDVAGIIFVSLALSVAGSLYPAGRAASVEPATAVQFDG
jgi:lipoprotein-releasing system permease protein